MWTTGAEKPERRTKLVGFRSFARYFAPLSQRKVAIIVFGFLFFPLRHMDRYTIVHFSFLKSQNHEFLVRV